MKITTEDVKNELRKLPISYYAFRKVDVKLDEEAETSYYSLTEDTIYINPSIIISGLENCNEKADFTKEIAVRSMFYHELSHAILTPKTLPATNVTNVIEDERIETLLSNYYINTNFKKQIFYINGINPDNIPAPTNAFEQFYHIVRFRKGTETQLKLVDEFIEKYKNINCTTQNSKKYEEACYILYRQLTYEAYKEEEQISTYSSSNIDSLGKGNKELSEDICNSSKNSNDENDNNEENAEKNSNKGCSINVGDIFKQINANNKNDYYEILNSIIESFNKRTNNGSGTTSYSGVLNPKNLRFNNYKYFDRKCNCNGSNKYGKYNLNLFIDNSGSFKDNAEEVNKIIFALSAIEKQNKNFTFTVVHLGNEYTMTEKKNCLITAGESTRLTMDIKPLFNKLQKSNCLNYNIILYDGFCYIDSYDRFKPFNHSNCLIITERSNKSNFIHSAPQAKLIIENKNYSSKLFENIKKGIERSLR